MKKCENCGLEVDEIPEFKEGECPGYIQHNFSIYIGVDYAKPGTESTHIGEI